MEDKDLDVLSTQTKITEKDAKSGAEKLEESSMAMSEAMDQSERNGGEECSSASAYNHSLHAGTGASGTADPDTDGIPHAAAAPRSDQSADSTLSQETSTRRESREANSECDVLNVVMHVDPFDRKVDRKGAKGEERCFTVRIPLESEPCEGEGAAAEMEEEATAARRGETLDALLACAAEEARRCGNPLRRLRTVLTRGAPPPSDDVRPFRLDEAGGDRYELFWSNLGLLRRYQDPLRCALSCRSVWSEDPSDEHKDTAGTQWELTDEDFRDFLTWQPMPEAAAEEELNAASKSPVDGEPEDDDGSSGSSAFSMGKAKRTESKEFHGNSVSNIWHVERDTQLEVDSGLKSVSKRVNFFFKSLFRVNKRFKKLE